MNSNIYLLKSLCILFQTDKNKDHLISLEEFLKMTEQQDFQKDEGWKVSYFILLF